MDSPPEVSHDDLPARLRRIGKVPRFFAFGLTILTAAVSWASAQSAPFLPAQIAIIALPALFFALSLRIRARVTGDALIIRSYLVTYTVEFEKVLGFSDVDYVGFWNRHTGGDGWLNLKLRMLAVLPLEGRQRGLPATMSFGTNIARIVDALNERVPDDLPEIP